VEKRQELPSSRYAVKIIPRRGKAATETHLEGKTTFEHQHVTQLDLMTEPVQFEDWSALKGEKGAAFDPSEILDYILLKGLGEAAFNELKEDLAKPVSRKRKTAHADDDIVDIVKDDAVSTAKKSRNGKGKAVTRTGPDNDTTLKKMRKEKGRNEQVQVTDSADAPKPLPTRPVFRMPSLPASMSPSSSQNETSSDLPNPTQLAPDNSSIRTDSSRNDDVLATLWSVLTDPDPIDEEDKKALYGDYDMPLMPCDLEDSVEQFDYDDDDMTLMPLDLDTTVEDDEDDDYTQEVAETRLSVLESNVGGSRMNVDDEDDDPDLLKLSG